MDRKLIKIPVKLIFDGLTIHQNISVTNFDGSVEKSILTNNFLINGPLFVTIFIKLSIFCQNILKSWSKFPLVFVYFSGSVGLISKIYLGMAVEIEYQFLSLEL